MSENVINVSEADDYIEDEFGLGLKGFLLARLVFGLICAFAVLGGIVCLLTGTSADVLISSATGLVPNAVDQNFDGYKLCMYAQAVYSLLSPVIVFLFMKERNKLYALIDLGLFVVFMGASIAMGALFANPAVTGEANLFTNGSAWILYVVFNPIWSFIALFVGKHFKYMPFIK